MSYDSHNVLSYLGDGIYWDWYNANLEDTDYFDNETTEERKKRTQNEIECEKKLKEKKQIYEEKIRLEKENRRHEKEILIKKNLYNLSKRFNSVQALKKSIFKLAVNKHLKIISKRYCLLENLPYDYAEVAMQHRILAEVIVSHLKRISVHLTSSELINLEKFLTESYENEKCLIVYDRVSEIQEKIHEVISMKLGFGSEYLVDKEVMRQLLSFARLHLSIHDLKNKNLADFINELGSVQIKRKQKESEVPLYVRKSGKKYIKNWNARHLKTLLYFSSERYRKFFSTLLLIEDKSSVEEFINVITKIWPLYELP